MKIRTISLFFALILCSQMALAKDILELDATEIQGASELPKVLYIVPWKKSAPQNKPIQVNTMVDEVMAPVDREVLRRQVNFFETAQAEKAEKTKQEMQEVQ